MSSGVEPLARLVLDTSAYSWMRSGHDEVLDWIAGADSILLPVTVLGELKGAFSVGRRTMENRTALNEFLGEPFVSLLPTTRSVARRYGDIYVSLRRAGTPIAINDVWIGAAAIDCGGHLLTFDRDFERISGLQATVLSTR